LFALLRDQFMKY